MQRIRVKGKASFRSTPAEYMWDMLRYDDGKIEAIWDWRFGLTFDLADGYQNAGIGVGFWH